MFITFTQGKMSSERVPPVVNYFWIWRMLFKKRICYGKKIIALDMTKLRKHDRYFLFPYFGVSAYGWISFESIFK